MDARYGYKYARIMENGLCRGVEDTTDYILNRLYVPIVNDRLPYLMKYYHPIPDVVNNFDDFQGKWYADVQFTIEVPELNV